KTFNSQINTVNHGNSSQWKQAFDWGNHANRYTQWLNAVTGADITTPSTSRFNPDPTNPTSAHYAGITYGNGSNVTGQLFTHFQTGESYLRGYNASFSAWRKIWDSSNFNPAQYVLQSSLNTQLANYATKAGTHTFTGTNTFTQAPYIPAGTLNGHAVNLGQLNTILGDYATETWVTQQINNISLTPGPQGPKGDKPAHSWSGT